MNYQTYALSLTSEDCEVEHEQDLMNIALGLEDFMWEDTDYQGESFFLQLTQESGQMDESCFYDALWLEDQDVVGAVRQASLIDDVYALICVAFMRMDASGSLEVCQENHPDAVRYAVIVDKEGCYGIGPCYEEASQVLAGRCPLLETMFDAFADHRKE